MHTENPTVEGHDGQHHKLQQAHLQHVHPRHLQRLPQRVGAAANTSQRTYMPVPSWSSVRILTQPGAAAAALQSDSGAPGFRRSAAGDQDQPSSQHNTPIHARPAEWHGESGCAPPYDPTPIIHEKR
jgi:hypothetical protein